MFFKRFKLYYSEETIVFGQKNVSKYIKISQTFLRDMLIFDTLIFSGLSFNPMGPLIL